MTRFEDKSLEELLSTYREEEKANDDNSLSDYVSLVDDKGDRDINPTLLLCNISSGTIFGEEAYRDELPNDLNIE